jgi:hypothetical protein
MRKLSDTFLECLKSGFLSGITQFVRADRDLNLEIREDLINIYFKGNNLLRLAETRIPHHYRASTDAKFREGIQFTQDLTESTVPQFIKNIPLIKENIIKYGKRTLEIEYEQMLIRANNYEKHSNTEYFIVDRQYTVKEGRFDLVGMYWKAHPRRPGQTVPVCLLEIKFALNHEIRELNNQLARYYEPIKRNAEGIAKELETVFQQKLELGLYGQTEDRLAVMKTLKFSPDINQFQFVVVLIDYNQNSKLLDLESIKRLPFADQVKVFYSGFGMWHHNVRPILEGL